MLKKWEKNYSMWCLSLGDGLYILLLDIDSLLIADDNVSVHFFWQTLELSVDIGKFACGLLLKVAVGMTNAGGNWPDIPQFTHQILVIKAIRILSFRSLIWVYRGLNRLHREQIMTMFVEETIR